MKVTEIKQYSKLCGVECSFEQEAKLTPLACRHMYLQLGSSVEWFVSIATDVMLSPARESNVTNIDPHHHKSPSLS